MRTLYLLAMLDLLFGIYLLQSPAAVPRRAGAVALTQLSVNVEKLPIAAPPHTPVLLLNSFETAKDIDNWILQYREPSTVKKSRTTEHPTQGKYSLKLNMQASSWAEMAFQHFPQEWEGYQMLALDVFNAGPSAVEGKLRIGCSFGDLEFDPHMSKYSEKRLLLPGNNTWILPLSAVARKINLNGSHKIIRILFIADAGTLFLDNLRLE